MNTNTIEGLDIEKVKLALSKFSNIEEDVSVIKKADDISKKDLLPVDFFNDIDLTTINSNVLNDYTILINKITDYINQIDLIDKGEIVTTDGSLNNTELASASDLVTNKLLQSINQSIDFLKQALIQLQGFNQRGLATSLEQNLPAVNGFFDLLRQSIDNILKLIAEFFTAVLSMQGTGTTTKKYRVSSYSNYSNSNNTEAIVDPINNEIEEVSEPIVEENKVVIQEEDKQNDNLNKEGLVVDENNNTQQNQLDSVNGNKIINKVLDSNGNVVAVSTINNGKKTWYQVSGNKVITPDNVLSTYKLGKNINITDNGQVISINAGEYPVEHVVYNADGSIKSVRLNCGNYRLVLGLNQNGDIDSINYIKSLSGVFSIDNTNYDIYDSYGNIVGKYNNGQYYIYETMYSEIGDVVGFRLSPDGEYEQWLYVNGNTLPSEYSLFETKQTNEKTSVSMFEKNKGLFGILGVLFVALGATVVMKKRIAKKEQGETENIEEDYNPNEWEEQGLTTGNYPIYDVKKDEDGNITDARINPVDNEFEYWVKV